MQTNLVVVFGGNSVEHEISIITATQAMENINKEKYNVIPVYMSKEGRFFYDKTFFSIDTFKDMNNIVDKMEVYFSKNGEVNTLEFKNKGIFSKASISNVDLVFPIVHGTNVEDGKLQGFFQTLGIPLIGTTTTSGTIGQDKAIMKDILKANDIKQTNYIWAYDNEDMDQLITKIHTKIGENVIVKPAELGSSVGIGIANNKEELIKVINDAFIFTSKIVIEQLVFDFKEVNISVVGNYKNFKISVTEEVAKTDDFLSYEDKYMSGNKTKTATKNSGMASLSRIIPANVDQEIRTQIEKIAANTFKALNCSGVVRLDLMIANNEVYVNEVNNIPGSLAYYLWEATDLSYTKLLDEVIKSGIDLFYDQSNRTFSIDTNVLNNLGSKIK